MESLAKHKKPTPINKSNLQNMKDHCKGLGYAGVTKKCIKDMSKGK